jgi:hypothetical protein
MESSPIRKAFLRTLRSKFIDYIYGLQLGISWSPTNIVAVAEDVINSHIDEINNFLDANQYTFKDSGKAIDAIITNILSPALERTKI